MALLDEPNAVMMRTLVLGELTLSFERASMPSSSGIRTSMITRSGLVSLTFSTTSVPVVASTTLYPSSDNNCLRSERMEASSSATRIVRCATFRTLPSHEGPARPLNGYPSCGRTIPCADDRTCQTGSVGLASVRSALSLTPLARLAGYGDLRGPWRQSRFLRLQSGSKALR